MGARLQEKYANEVVPALMKRFGYTNSMQVPALEKIVVTDTIPLKSTAGASEKIAVTTVAPLLGEAIRRIHNEESVSSLFV